MTIRNNSTISSLLLAGLATGAAAWYFFGTENGKKAVSRLADTLKDVSESVASKANETIADLKNKAGNYTA